MLDIATVALLVFGLLLFLLVASVQIGVALGTAGLLGIMLAIGPDAARAQLAFVPFSTTNSFALAVVPLFILMGAFATQAALTTDLYRAANLWLGRLPGGLAIATTVASAMFGAASGSTVVNAAIFSRIALPEMTRFGYDKGLSAGSIAASGTLASLIPPSVLMVVYAIITEQPIATLLIAGLVPGLLSGLLYILSIVVRAKRNPDIAPAAQEPAPLREKVRSLRGVWGICLLFGLVLGGIYSGLFVPTYAGAIGAFGAMLIVIARRKLSWRSLIEIFKDTGTTTSVIFMIVIGGMLFARFLSYSGLVGSVTEALMALEMSRWVYLGCFMLLYLVLGMFIEPMAIMVITLPVMFPVLTGAGFDPIWLGVISIKLAEMSLMTPPVGLNVYVVRSASPVPITLGQVFHGTYPFLLMDVISLALFIAFPAIVTFLPAMMSLAG